MLRHFFTLLTAVSLVLGMATGVLWGKTRHGVMARQFQRHGILWEVSSQAGRLSLDNLPQLDREKIAEQARRKDLMHECNVIASQHAALQRRLRRADETEKPAIEVEEARVKALANANGVARQSAFHQPLYTTAAVVHSTPHAVAVAATALLPIGWLALAVRRMVEHRRRRMNRRCVLCGYDLRASPGRCPECGSADAMQEVSPQMNTDLHR